MLFFPERVSLGFVEKASFALVRFTESRENPVRENASAKKTIFHLQMSI